MAHRVAQRVSTAPGRRGFTLIELLVVVAIIALLISMLLPSLGKAKEMANRVYCAASLRGIGQSLFIYGYDNNSMLPACLPPNSPGSFTNSFTAVPSATNNSDGMALSVAGNSGVALSSMWIMCLRSLAYPKMLVCKSDRFAVGPAQMVNGLNYFANFQDEYQISYSTAYPWSPNWRLRQETSQPLMADMAPLSGAGSKNTTMLKGQTTKAFNSSNHDDAGQTVMYGDGHAVFERDPYVGYTGNDNIYTVGPSASQAVSTLNSIGGLNGSDDAVMVPVRNTSTGQMGN